MTRRKNRRVTNPKSSRIVPALLAWFSANARDLPWRRTRDTLTIVLKPFQPISVSNQLFNLNQLPTGGDGGGDCLHAMFFRRPINVFNGPVEFQDTLGVSWRSMIRQMTELERGRGKLWATEICDCSNLEKTSPKNEKLHRFYGRWRFCWLIYFGLLRWINADADARELFRTCRMPAMTGWRVLELTRKQRHRTRNFLGNSAKWWRQHSKMRSWK